MKELFFRKALSQCTHKELEEVVSKSGYLKWDTLCRLKLIGLPVLEAYLIEPYSSKLSIEQAVDSFISLISNNKHEIPNLMIRSDSKGETKDYPISGVSSDINYIKNFASDLSSGGRAVIIFPPTNRFTTLVNFNINCSRDGGFFIEIIGPGYDSSDLRRGLVPPHYVIESNPFRAKHIFYYNTKNKLSIFDIIIKKIPVSEEIRRNRRLEVIATKVLPNMGVNLSGSNPIEEAENWLKSFGYNFLWTKQLNLSLDNISEWLVDASELAFYFFQNNQKNEDFILGGSVITESGKNPRKVYWDYYTADRWDLSVKKEKYDLRI